ncbi:hypothetical protein Pelo_16319 [Pelomyxa schiedti]|nr:hypothetical protein Pelo_16319 [Pelomyxa schiedti]
MNLYYELESFTPATRSVCSRSYTTTSSTRSSSSCSSSSSASPSAGGADTSCTTTTTTTSSSSTSSTSSALLSDCGEERKGVVPREFRHNCDVIFDALYNDNPLSSSSSSSSSLPDGGPPPPRRQHNRGGASKAKGSDDWDNHHPNIQQHEEEEEEEEAPGKGEGAKGSTRKKNDGKDRPRRDMMPNRGGGLKSGMERDARKKRGEPVTLVSAQVACEAWDKYKEPSHITFSASKVVSYYKAFPIQVQGSTDEDSYSGGDLDYLGVSRSGFSTVCYLLASLKPNVKFAAPNRCTVKQYIDSDFSLARTIHSLSTTDNSKYYFYLKILMAVNIISVVPALSGAFSIFPCIAASIFLHLYVRYPFLLNYNSFLAKTVFAMSLMASTQNFVGFIVSVLYCISCISRGSFMTFIYGSVSCPAIYIMIKNIRFLKGHSGTVALPKLDADLDMKPKVRIFLLSWIMASISGAVLDIVCITGHWAHNADIVASPDPNLLLYISCGWAAVSVPVQALLCIWLRLKLNIRGENRPKVSVLGMMTGVACCVSCAAVAFYYYILGQEDSSPSS